MNGRVVKGLKDLAGEELSFYDAAGNLVRTDGERAPANAAPMRR